MAACNRFPYTHSALPAKNASIWLVHTHGAGGAGAAHRRVANGFRLLDLFVVFPVSGGCRSLPSRQ